MLLGRMAHRLGLVAAVLVLGARTEASPAMQTQARKAGLPAANCQYCHATCESTEVMKQKARSLGVSEGNCLVCHGSRLPSKLNERGQWLVAEKAKRGAKALDMAWLKDYTEPTPAPPKQSASSPRKP